MFGIYKTKFLVKKGYLWLSWHCSVDLWNFLIFDGFIILLARLLKIVYYILDKSQPNVPKEILIKSIPQTTNNFSIHMKTLREIL
jgi:hypothetical protein